MNYDYLASRIEHRASRIEHRENRIKVLFIIWSLEKGGAERFLVSLVKHLDRTKIKPIVCCLNWKGVWAKELEELGIEVIALNKKGKFDISVIFKLIRVIKEHKIDIVNTHLWGADVLGRLAAIIAGVPVIISTAQNEDIWKKWWHRLVDKLLSFKTDMIIAVSEAVKRYYHEVGGILLSKITVIPNAIEVEKLELEGDINYLYAELGVKKDDFLLACIGRLDRQKGHEYLFEALSSLNGKYNVKLLVVGDGSLKMSLQQSVVSYQLQNKVIFTGTRSDIPQILQMSHCLVLPSLYEGLPLCVLEAMAAAKPVIGTNVGGIPEVVIDQETGFIVPAKNTKALTQAIQSLINLPDRGKAMGKKGREIVKNNFSIQAIAKKTEELFAKLFKE